MSNQLATCSIIAKEALAILDNMLSFTTAANRDWEDEFKSNLARGYAPGQTINIKKPPRYVYRAGRVAVPQATVETTIPLTVNQGGCDLNFNGLERTLSLTQLEKKITAAMAPVANEIDRQGLALAAASTWNVVGTPGAPPTTQAQALAAIMAVNQRLDEMSAPRDGRRSLIMGPALNASLVIGMAGMFNSQKTLDKQFDRGVMVDSLGLAYAMDQNVSTITNGSQPVTGTNIAGAGQTGNAINIVATTGTINVGDKITLPGVYAVNTQTRQSTGSLAQFTVTANVAVGATVLPINPALVTLGAFQNVSNSPTTGLPYTIFGLANGAFTMNIGFHEDAFTLAMVPMWAPPSGKGVIDVATQSYKGMSIKATEFYDGINDNSVIRLDVLFGWAATYPELSVGYAT